MRDGADMILMGMGGDDAQHIVAPLHQIADVGQDQVHARRIALAPEQHAAIDNDPAPVILRAIAIGIEIHADLARAAKRQEDQFVLFDGAGHQAFFALLRAWISISPRMVRSGSIWWMAGMSGRKRCDSPPVATTVMGFPYSFLMPLIRPVISPT